MNPQLLLEQFLGGNAGNTGNSGNAPTAGGGAWGAAQGVKDALNANGFGGFGGGLAAGGLLGVLVGSKKVRKMAGGVVGYGGAAVLGALAYRAYQNWQAGKNPNQAPAASQADMAPAATEFLPSQAADGRPFALALILAMIAAAKADNHIGPDEQRQIFDRVAKAGLDAESKAFIFDALARPIAVSEIGALASGPEQGSELYLASRLAIDPDQPEEKMYLEALAHRLKLPNALVAHLEHQVSSEFAIAGR